MYEREKVGISLEMLLCFLLGFTIHLFSDGSGDTDGSGVSGDTGDLFSVVGKSTKFAQFWLRIYKIGSKVFSY